MSTILDRLGALAAVVRRDGWQNALTGLGTAARDKVMSTFYGRSLRMSEQQLEELFHTNDMAARIVEKIVDDALRAGWSVKVQADDADVTEDQEVERAIKTALEDLGANEKIAEAATWGRLYGGGSIYMLVDDGAMPWEELRPERVRRVTSLLVLDARDHWPVEYERDRSKPGFDEPVLYQLNATGPDGRPTEYTRVHASRLVTFGGQRTALRRKLENSGWSASVLERPNEALKQFGVTWQAVAHLMVDGAQGVLKMKGLIDMISANQPELLRARMQTVDMSRSVARALLLDESEDFTRQEVTMTGYAAMMKEIALRLAAAADMPVTVLMGQSPAGMNATGESDRSLWDERVQAYQTNVLHARMRRLVAVLLASREGPTRGRVPDDWKVEYAPLRQMTEKEQAEIKKLVAETDAIYLDRQVYQPEEVAVSRFPAEGWSPDMRLDLAVREQILEADQKAALERAKNPPPPPPALPPAQTPADDDAEGGTKGEDDENEDEDEDDADDSEA